MSQSAKSNLAEMRVSETKHNGYMSTDAGKDNCFFLLFNYCVIIIRGTLCRSTTVTTANSSHLHAAVTVVLTIMWLAFGCCGCGIIVSLPSVL